MSVIRDFLKNVVWKQDGTSPRGGISPIWGHRIKSTSLLNKKYREYPQYIVNNLGRVLGSPVECISQLQKESCSVQELQKIFIDGSTDSDNKKYSINPYD